MAAAGGAEAVNGEKKDGKAISLHGEQVRSPPPRLGHARIQHRQPVDARAAGLAPR
jgi:hypothetical protein